MRHAAISSASLSAAIVLLLAGNAAFAQQAPHVEHLTPTCRFESQIAYKPPAPDETQYLQTGFSAVRHNGNIFVISCFAYDYEQLDGDDGSCAANGNNNNLVVDPYVQVAHVTEMGRGGQRFDLRPLFRASLVAVVFEIDDSAYYSFPRWRLGFELRSSCDVDLRYGMTFGVGAVANSGIDLANMVDLHPAIVVIGRPTTFTFERESAYQRSAPDTPYPGDHVVLLRDHESCFFAAHAQAHNFGQVQYSMGTDGRIRFHFDFTFVNAGYYVVCSRFQGSNDYVEAAYVRVYGSNPQFFRSADLGRGGTTTVGELVEITFFGENLDASQDCAKVMLGSRPCSENREMYMGGVLPSCDPRHAQNGGPNSTLVNDYDRDSPVAIDGFDMVSWNISLTYAGSYRICYRPGPEGTTWEDIFHYDELNKAAKEWFFNDTNSSGGIVPGTNTSKWRTRTATPSVSREPTLTAEPAATAIPNGTKVCVATTAGGGNVTYLCPVDLICSPTAPECLQTETAAPAPTTTAAPPATLPPWALNCSFVNATDGEVLEYWCNATANETCSDAAEAVCISDVVPAVPVTAPPGYVECQASYANGSAAVFFCPNGTACGSEPDTCAVVDGTTSVAPGTEVPPTPPPATIPDGFIECPVLFPNGSETGNAFLCVAANETCGANECVINATETASLAPTATPAPTPTGTFRCSVRLPNNATVFWYCPIGTTCGAPTAANPDPCVQPVQTDTTLPVQTTTAAPPPTGVRCDGANGSVFYCPVNATCGDGFCVAPDPPTDATVVAPTQPPNTRACPGANGTVFYCPLADTCGDGECLRATETTFVPATTTTAAPPQNTTLCPGPPPFYCATGEQCGNGTCISATQIITGAPDTTAAPATAPPGFKFCPQPAGATSRVLCPVNDTCGPSGTCISSSTLPAPTLPAPTTAAPVTAAPGTRLCPGPGGTVFACLHSETCGANGTCITSVTVTAGPVPTGERRCVAPNGNVFYCTAEQRCGVTTCLAPPETVTVIGSTNAPTVTTTPAPTSVPPGMRLCPGTGSGSAFYCNATFSCGPGYCIAPAPTTPTTPAPTLPNGDTFTVCDIHGPANAFRCPITAPVCCYATQRCCPTGTVCSGTTCVVPTTAAPPTTTIPAGSTSAGLTTTAAPTMTVPPTASPTPAPPTRAPCPTAPAEFAGFSPSAEPLLDFEFEGSTVPSAFEAQLAQKICVPEDALVMQQAGTTAAGRATVRVRIACGATECDNVERMNYALWLFSSSSAERSAAGLAAVQKADDGSTITAVESNNAAANDGSEAHPVNTMNLALIICGTLLILAIIAAIVLIVRKRRRDQYARNHMRFVMDGEVARESVARHADERDDHDGVRRADERGGYYGADVEPAGFVEDASFTSDTPLEMGEVEVVVDIVPEKRASY